MLVEAQPKDSQAQLIWVETVNSRNEVVLEAHYDRLSLEHSLSYWYKLE